MEAVASSPRETLPADAVGGRYTAVRGEDGTWTILDVPILYDCEFPLGKGADGKPRHWHFDRAWMQAAIENAERRRAEGYMGRGFVTHHDPDTGTDSEHDAGFVMPRRVGTVTIDEEQVDALFADLERVPGETYWMIRQGRYPYRSIEANKLGERFVDGVALMKTRAPFCRLPMLTIGREVTVTNSVVEMQAALQERAGLVAVCSAGAALSALLRFDVSDKPDTTDDDAKPDDKGGAPAKDAKDESQKPDAEKPEVVPAWAARLLRVLTGIASKLGAGDDDQDVGGGAGPKDQDDPRKTSKPEGAKAMADTTTTDTAQTAALPEDVSAKLSALQKQASDADAKAAALQLRLDAQDAEKALLAAVDESMAALQRERVAIGTPETMRATLLAHGKKHGITALADQVAMLKQYGSKAPPESLDGADAAVSAGATDLPPAALKFTSLEDRTLAVGFCREYRDGRARGLLRAFPNEDEYVTVRLKAHREMPNAKAG